MSDQKNPYNFSRADIHDGAIDAHIEHISHEFRAGFALLKKYPKSVSIFGSSVAVPEMQTYKDAETLSGLIVRELGYAVITGGGPGIMEAANKGAYEAGGSSIGLHISLPHEHMMNAYATESMKFSYFFARKTMLTFAAEAFIFFPGGYGTLDELTSILTLIQTQKIPRIPVILFGSEYWNSFRGFLKTEAVERYHAINDEGLNLFDITDSLEHVIEVIRKAPVSEWWRNIN